MFRVLMVVDVDVELISEVDDDAMGDALIGLPHVTGVQSHGPYSHTSNAEYEYAVLVDAVVPDDDSVYRDGDKALAIATLLKGERDDDLPVSVHVWPVDGDGDPDQHGRVW